MLATVGNLRSERESAAASHQELLDSSRRAIKAPNERKHKAADTFVKLREIHGNGREIPVEAYVEE